MSYKNGENILPERLLKEIQQYIQGEIIYIPKNPEGRVPWGTKNGARKDIKKRNQQILELYEDGYRWETLADNYSLSEHSIKKIVIKTRKELRETI